MLAQISKVKSTPLDFKEAMNSVSPLQVKIEPDELSRLVSETTKT